MASVSSFRTGAVIASAWADRSFQSEKEVGCWSSERVAGVMVDFFGGYLMIFYLKKKQRLRGIGILYLPTFSINLSQIYEFENVGTP